MHAGHSGIFGKGILISFIYLNRFMVSYIVDRIRSLPLNLLIRLFTYSLEQFGFIIINNVFYIFSSIKLKYV